MLQLCFTMILMTYFFTTQAVTVLGRVFFRQGVNGNNPEGSGWLHIPTPETSEASQISIGPTGLVWAVTWQGKALVRTGTRHLFERERWFILTISFDDRGNAVMPSGRELVHSGATWRRKRQSVPCGGGRKLCVGREQRPQGMGAQRDQGIWLR